MFNILTQLKTKQEILIEAFDLYRKSFSRVIGYAFIATILLFVPQLILGSVLKNTTNTIGAYLTTLAPLSILWSLSLFFVSGLIFRLHCIANNVPNRFIGCLSQAIFKFIPLLLLCLLYSFIVISGTLILIIPGLIFAVSLMLSFSIFIIGNQSALKSLTTSHNLIVGHWWFSLGVISLPMLINIAVSLAVFLSLLYLGIVLKWQVFTLYLLTFISGIIIQTLFIPLIFSIVLVLLQELNKRKMTMQPSW